VARHLESGALVVVGEETPPEPIQMACLFTHRRHQDPKSRLFMDFVSDRIAGVIKDTRLPDQLPR
jgi:DNA-binding transcriptional LysR family regulator